MLVLGTNYLLSKSNIRLINRSFFKMQDHPFRFKSYKLTYYEQAALHSMMTLVDDLPNGDMWD